MKTAIIGTGGVGGYFGGKLAKAGFDVTFVARGAHLMALKNNGLSVKSILGDFSIKDVKVTDRITNSKEPDLILIATKAWQIKEVRDDIKQIIHPGTIILPLQNGISAAEELAEVIDNSQVAGGLCRIISKIDAPGVINHFAITPTIVFGELNKSKSDRLSAVKRIFDLAEINSILSDDIEADLWRKFIGICVSGLLAITKTTYGELRSLKETREMMIALLREIYLLSQKAGIQIEPDFVEKTVAAVDTFPYESTTSLSRDVSEGRPSEIEYQNGTVVRLAAKYNLDVPVNTFVYNCILPMEKKARGLKVNHS
jgi:2-dehydropantoate 2-reductase